jgi:hypothetical protein
LEAGPGEECARLAEVSPRSCCERSRTPSACLLNGGLHLFDLPIRRFAQPLGLLDKFTPTRNGLRRLTQIGCLG